MGNAVRCSRCNKGINLNEKWVAIQEDIYHAKCAKRLEKAR